MVGDHQKRAPQSQTDVSTKAVLAEVVSWGDGMIAVFGVPFLVQPLEMWL
jgi:hypothetical protein